jgi:flagellar biosynthetic protein FliQ
MHWESVFPIQCRGRIEGQMNNDIALQLMSKLLLEALLVAAPILGLTLVVGLLISIAQVVTQVQDASLTFVPKIIAAVIAMAVFGPWMLRSLLHFATELIAGIPGYF